MLYFTFSSIAIRMVTYNHITLSFTHNSYDMMCIPVSNMYVLFHPMFFRNKISLHDTLPLLAHFLSNDDNPIILFYGLDYCKPLFLQFGFYPFLFFGNDT